MDLFRLDTVRDSKTTFLTLKRYKELSLPFYIHGSPPRNVIFNDQLKDEIVILMFVFRVVLFNLVFPGIGKCDYFR